MENNLSVSRARVVEKVMFAQEFLDCPEALVRMVRGIFFDMRLPAERSERLIYKTHLWILECYEASERGGMIPKGSCARYALAAGVAKEPN